MSDWKKQLEQAASKLGIDRQPDASASESLGGQRTMEEYLKLGYFDDNGNLRDEFITALARSKARELRECDLSPNQLHTFFAAVMGIRRTLRQARRSEEVESFQKVRGQLLLLEALAYETVSKGRKGHPPKDWSVFADFITKNVHKAAEDEPSFLEGFIPHFTAVMCYFRYLEPPRRPRGGGPQGRSATRR